MHPLAQPASRNACTLTLLILLGGASLAQTTPAKPGTPPTPASAATSRNTSALAIEVNGVIKGQFLDCPVALKLSPRAVCFFVKNTAANLRPLIKTKLAARAAGDWKTGGKSSVILVQDSANQEGSFVLISALNDQESLVSFDAAQAKAAPPKPAPTGVTKGEPYVLGSDLVGVVSVTNLGLGKYTLAADGSPPLTVTVGQKSAQTSSGKIELPLPPATDGKNLIFPLNGLRALGCTVAKDGSALTVACGKNSIGLKPIVF